MNKEEFSIFLEEHSREELLNFQDLYGRDELRVHYNLSYGNLRELVNIKDLHISKEDANKKRKSTWENKESSNKNRPKILCTLISKDELYNYYIYANHSFSETKNYFNISKNDLLKLIHVYNCYKPKNISHKIAERTWIKTLGVDNPTKSEMIQNKSKKTCMDKYGRENTFFLSKSKDSKPNLKFKSRLEESGIIVLDENREFPLKNYLFDFKVDDNLIEINPAATHNSNWSPFDKEEGLSKDYHYNKSKLARDNGYRCIHVWDWDNIDKIISLLLPRETIYARKCEIREVNYTDSNLFINKYHLQGDTKKNNSDIRIGLYYNNELVSLMTFGKPRYNKNYEYELLRYCSSYKVIGGAEKIFKYFLNNYNPNSIISYCDLSKFNGDTYIKLGFKEKNISISKHWYNIKTKQHITDNLLRQRGFDQLFGTDYGKGTSNEELMLNAGFVEIYDAGQSSYVYTKESE